MLNEIFEEVAQFLERIWSITGFRLFTLTGTDFTIGDVIYFVFGLSLVIYISTWVKNILANKILTRYHLDIGIRQSIATIVRYVILVIGLFIVFQTAGINLSALGLVAGALGVGIGFGLQNVTNNFICGIIILFERPVKIGDRIEVGKVTGDVVKISARATTVLTNDNIAVIVPNSDFINSTVINWSHNDRMVRFDFPFRASLREDPAKVRKAVIEVANENPGVLNHPAPDVLIESFGDNASNFILRIWTSDYVTRPNTLKSQLYYGIHERFRQENIAIPLPQREIRMKSDGDFLPISNS